MPLTWEQFKENYYKLPDSATDETIIDVLDSELSPAAKAALVAQLEPRIIIVIEAEYDARRATIRDVATKLPADDPLRIAIEAIL